MSLLLERLDEADEASEFDAVDAIVVLDGDPPPAAAPIVSRREREHRRRRRRRRRFVVLGLFALLAVPAWSLGRALAADTTDPLGVRAVEWARDHHFGGLVDRVEHYWYTHHEPARGGTPEHGIPRVATDAAPLTTPSTAAAPTITSAPSAVLAAPVPSVAPTTVPKPFAPTAVSPFVPAAAVLSGEGLWQAAGRPVGGTPAAWVAYLRPDDVHTSQLTALAYFDMRKLRATQHQGTELPGGGPWQHGARIDPANYDRVVAAFNGGFTLHSSKGGWYAEGKTIAPLVPGRASLVTYRDGHADIAAWGRDATMNGDIMSVRQNLNLLIDGGTPARDVDSNWVWGGTLGNEVYVWRSGVGINARGDLIYAGGPGLNVASLAAVLQRAGAVRAMELDINSYWVSAMTFTSGTAGGVVPRKLLDAMPKPPGIYLQNQTRDFVELDAR